MFMNRKRRFLIRESLKRKFISRWFLGINIILFLLILISFNIDSIITFFGGDFKDKKTIIVLDKADIFDDFEEQFLNISEFAVTEYEIIQVDYSVDEIKTMAKKDVNIIGIELLKSDSNFIEANVYTIKGLSTINKSIISSSLNNIKKEIALKKYGITNDKIKAIEKAVDVNSIILADKAVNENKDISSAVTVIAFIIPCFFLITTLVQMIGSEINEEKTTKSMEIIVSNVPAKDHLLAKISSSAIFMIAQISLLLLFVLISSLIHSSHIGTLSSSSTQGFMNAILGNLMTDNLLAMIKMILPILIISFLFTIITYAILAGVLASMTTNIDDFQQLQTPLMLIISIGFYLSLLAAAFEGSLFIKFMAFVPLISLKNL